MLGTLKVHVNIRQDIPATATVDTYKSDVAYEDNFDIFIVSCLTETIEFDTTDTASALFISTYDNQLISGRFGSDFEHVIQFNEQYLFPNALDLCPIVGYEITCQDNQIDVNNPSAAPDPALSKIYRVDGSTPDNTGDLSQTCTH